MYNNSNKLEVPVRMNPGIYMHIYIYIVVCMKQVSHFCLCYKFSRIVCPQWTLLTAFSDGWPTVAIAEEIAAALGSYNLRRRWRWTPCMNLWKLSCNHCTCTPYPLYRSFLMGKCIYIIYLKYRYVLFGTQHQLFGCATDVCDSLSLQTSVVPR